MAKSLDGADLLLKVAREVVVELILEEGERGIERARKGVEVVEDQALGSARGLSDIRDTGPGEAARAHDIDRGPEDALAALLGCLRGQ